MFQLTIAANLRLSLFLIKRQFSTLKTDNFFATLTNLSLATWNQIIFAPSCFSVFFTQKHSFSLNPAFLLLNYKHEVFKHSAQKPVQQHPTSFSAAKKEQKSSEKNFIMKFFRVEIFFLFVVSNICSKWEHIALLLRLETL